MRRQLGNVSPAQDSAEAQDVTAARALHLKWRRRVHVRGFCLCCECIARLPSDADERAVLDASALARLAMMRTKRPAKAVRTGVVTRKR